MCQVLWERRKQTRLLSSWSSSWADRWNAFTPQRFIASNGTEPAQHSTAWGQIRAVAARICQPLVQSEANSPGGQGCRRAWRIHIRDREGVPKKWLTGFKNKNQNQKRPGQGGRGTEPGRAGGPPGRQACGSFSQDRREGGGRFSVGPGAGRRWWAGICFCRARGCRGGRARKEVGEGPRWPPCEPRGDRDGQRLGSCREANRSEIHPGARLSGGVRREANHLSFQTSRQWL